MHPLLWHRILDQLQELILPLLESPLDHLHLTEVLILELCILLLDFTRDHMLDTQDHMLDTWEHILDPSHLTHIHTQHIQDQILARNMWWALLCWDQDWNCLIKMKG